MFLCNINYEKKFLACTLYSALTAENYKGSANHLDNVDDYIRAQSIERNGKLYLLGSSIVIIFIGITGLLINFLKIISFYDYILVLNCGISGSIGAMVSVLQRYYKLNLDAFVAPEFSMGREISIFALPQEILIFPNSISFIVCCK